MNCISLISAHLFMLVIMPTSMSWFCVIQLSRLLPPSCDHANIRSYPALYVNRGIASAVASYSHSFSNVFSSLNSFLIFSLSGQHTSENVQCLILITHPRLHVTPFQNYLCSQITSRLLHYFAYLSRSFSTTTMRSTISVGKPVAIWASSISTCVHQTNSLLTGMHYFKMQTACLKS
jgi:hypothetical protein